VALIFFAILKTNGDGFHMLGRRDVPANFGHQVPKPVLLLHVQVVEASYVTTGSNHNVARRQGLRSQHGAFDFQQVPIDFPADLLQVG
jgi:hypothetical protein